MHQLLKRPARPAFHKRRWVRVAGVLLMLVAAYGLYRAVRPDPNLKKVRQLQAEMAKARDLTPEQRREKGREMRQAMSQLSTGQRQTLFAEGQKRFEEQLRKYAEMTPADKTRHLDEQIKRSEQMRQQFAQRNPAGQRPQGTNQNGQRSGQSAEEREKRRKDRLNNTSPEFRALMDQYRKDMASRRQQWGLPAGGGGPRPRT
jgi:hypothetical protein